MRDSDRSPGIFRGNLWLIPPAVLLGATAGVFCDAYWLRSLLPLADEQSLVLIVAISLLAAAAYFLLLRWFRSCLHGYRAGRVIGLALIGVPIGAFVFFGGTSRWLKSDLYLTALLPQHQLRLSAPPSAEAGQTALVWFTTSLGDVSYDEIQATGWTRQGDELVLQAPSNNSLAWIGQTGATAQMIFRAAKVNTTLQVWWDGQPENLAFSRTKSSYERVFAVPFYASGELLTALGLVNFLLLSMGLVLAVDRKRSSWKPAMERSFAPFIEPLNRWDWIALTGSFCLALLLRAFNLGSVFPAVDEYYHLIAAQQIIQGAALDSVYPRGLWLVTLPVALAIRLFGHHLWAARLMGVLVNSLAVIPLYLLTRKLNRPVAVLACLLYATSPWIITFARMAREYAYYPFYFYLIILGMVAFLERIPVGLVLLKDWKAILKPPVLLLGLLLLIPPVFALRIDWLSTFRTVLIAYLVFGLFMLGRLDWRAKLNWPTLAVLAAALILIGVSWYQEQATKLLTLPALNALPLEYFLPNPQQQWYFNRLVVVIPLALVAALAIGILARRVNFVPAFMLALFASYLVVFTFLSKTFFHTRHLLTTELWYVVVVALGLYALWLALQALLPAKRLAGGLLAGLLLGVSVLNVPQILLPSLSTNPDMPISEDYLHDMSKVQDFMLHNAQPGDALISTVYGLYATWEQRPAFAAQYRITSQTPVQEIFSIVDQNASGWIVFDKIRLDLSGISLRDITGKHQIEYIGLFGDEYVWRWQRTSTRAIRPGVLE